MRDSGEVRGIALTIGTILFVVFMSYLLGCDKTPVADQPPLAEQQKHTIRLLARNSQAVGPTVYLIEVDGEQFVAVDGYGVAKKNNPVVMPTTRLIQ